MPFKIPRKRAVIIELDRRIVAQLRPLYPTIRPARTLAETALTDYIKLRAESAHNLKIT